MGKHSEVIRRINCPWRKAIASVMAFVTAGIWVPFAYTMQVEAARDDDDDESGVPPFVFEPHPAPSWPEQRVPRPPVVSLEKHKPKPEMHNPADAHPQRQHTPPPVTRPVKIPLHPVTNSTGVLVAFLRAQLGETYVLGGNGPDVWDCSGLTKAAYATLGVHLPRTSEEQSLRGVRVSLSQLEVGDLLFWGAGPGLAYHVAIYIGGGRYIAAQNPSVGVVERTLSFSPPNFARRIL
jgi:cell wall-associated NlpC family hydrolase